MIKNLVTKTRLIMIEGQSTEERVDSTGRRVYSSMIDGNWTKYDRSDDASIIDRGIVRPSSNRPIVKSSIIVKVPKLAGRLSTDIKMGVLGKNT